jgi:hypothetical protein
MRLLYSRRVSSDALVDLVDLRASKKLTFRAEIIIPGTRSGNTAFSIGR